MEKHTAKEVQSNFELLEKAISSTVKSNTVEGRLFSLKYVKKAMDGLHSLLGNFANGAIIEYFVYGSISVDGETVYNKAYSNSESYKIIKRIAIYEDWSRW